MAKHQPLKTGLQGKPKPAGDPQLHWAEGKRPKEIESDRGKFAFK